MKGISNIISATLLIGISLSMMSLYSGWVTEYSGSSTERVVGQLEDSMKCENANIRVDNAEYRDGEVQLEIKNTGTINLEQGLNSYVLSSSEIVAEGGVESLLVGETTDIDMSSEEPDEAAVISQDCPGLERTVQLN